MNAAAAITSARAAQPDRSRAWARASATLNAAAVLVSFIGNVIGQGRRLARACRGHPAASGDTPPGRRRETRVAPVSLTNWRGGIIRGAALCRLLWHHANPGLGALLPALRRDRAQAEPGGAFACSGVAATDNVPAQAAHPQSRQACDLPSRPTQPAVADPACRPAAHAPHITLDLVSTTATAGALRDSLPVRGNRLGFRLTPFLAKVDRCKAPASRIEPPRFEAPPEHQRPNCLSAVEQLRDVLPPQAASAGCLSPQAEPCTASRQAFQRSETVPVMQRPVLPRQAREVAATASH